MNVKFNIDTKFKTTPPHCRFFSSIDETKLIIDKNSQVIELDLNFHQNDFIGIEFLNKGDADDNIVEIKKVSIDDIDLQHFIFNGTFEPVYNIDWYNKQITKPPKVYKPGTLLRHHGIWKLDILLPILKMVLDFWVNDEK